MNLYVKPKPHQLKYWKRYRSGCPLPDTHLHTKRFTLQWMFIGEYILF